MCLFVKDGRRKKEEEGTFCAACVWHKTNPWNKGLISADRNARIALMLTIPRSLVKSSTKDLSFPIFEIVFQRTHTHRLVTGVGAAIL